MVNVGKYPSPMDHPMGMEVVFALWRIFLQVGHGGSWVLALESIKMHRKH